MNPTAEDVHSDSIATPQDEKDVIDVVRESNSASIPIRIVGAGNWLDAGRTVSARRVLSTSRLSGIVDYVPGDLVLTARAGTTLGELADITAKHGQWFALDPYGRSSGTLGATIATASSGPLATGFGRARDLVLGIAAVTGNGQHIRVGGRVVKNVAGFDLVRLLTGSWGTLAVITEVSVRLHALPQQERSVIVQLAAGSLGAQLATLRTMPLSTMALQLVDAGTASKLTERSISQPVLLVRLGGNAARVEAQRALLAQLGACHDVDDRIWIGLRELELASDDTAPPFVLRVSKGAARSAELFVAVTSVAARAGADIHVSVSPLDGVVRIIGFAPATALPFLEAAHAFNASVIGERLQQEDWNRLPNPMNHIAQGIRDRFDLARILNRGMFEDSTNSPALS
jgi:glycolate oxidase FAD binding subunit